MAQNARVSGVVGGTGGIGSQIVRKLARVGDRVVITYRSAEEKVRTRVAEIESGGGKCLALRADLGSQEAVASLFKEILERCGRIDVLVNTQGYIHQLSLFQEEAPEDTQRTLDVELMSVINQRMPGGHPADDPAEQRLHRHRRFRFRHGGLDCRSYLRRLPWRRHRFLEIARPRTRPKRHHRQRHLPGTGRDRLAGEDAERP